MTPRKQFLILLFPLLGLAAAGKWVMIHYGLPFPTHVDEMDILTDPFKILSMYSQGNFSVSTNLFNWLITFWFALVFVLGWIFNAWSSVEEFRLFLISGSSSFILAGRLMSMVLSLAGSTVLFHLMFRLQPSHLLRILMGVLIFFNPFEWNALNWVKFDALSYLVAAVLIYFGFLYFIEGRERMRTALYFLLFVGIASRIEMIAFAAGFTLYDLFLFKRFELNRIPWRPVFAGMIFYGAVTLLPVAVLAGAFSSAPKLSTTPTFFEAIVTKLPDWGSLLRVIGESNYYFICLAVLFGPAWMLDLLLNFRSSRIRFLALPIIVLAAALFIFPIKNVHYLVVLATVLLVAYLITLNGPLNKWKLTAVIITAVWTVSYTIQLVFGIAAGDSRLPAREFVLRNTQPGDMVYADGIFSSIYDTPERYHERAEASRRTGGTGLSNDYMATHVLPAETRAMVAVSSWEPFKGTGYENRFYNHYDSARLHDDHPEFYLYVGDNAFEKKPGESASDPNQAAYYRYLQKNYEQRAVFKSVPGDPRFHFVNAYYFRPVLVFERRKG